MKIRFSCIRGAAAMLVMASAAVAVFAQETRTRTDLLRSFRKFDLVRVAPARMRGEQAAERRLNVRADGRDFELVIEPYDLRSERYRADDTRYLGSFPAEPAVINTYKGKIAGLPVSEVRLTLDEGSVSGFFQAGFERFFIEPAKKYSDAASADEAIVYREEDSLVSEALYCNADIPDQIEYGGELIKTGDVRTSEAQKVMEIATDADYAYVTTLGGASQANSNILSIMNMIEGTYNAELGIKIRVVFQHTWTSPDPYTGTSTSTLLPSFQNWFNENYPMSSVPRDVTHLFTAKSYAMSAGIAYVGVVCSSPEFAYGLSGYVSWAPGKFLVPAHEIGHNFGANHAESNQGCGNTLMNAYLSPSAQLTFCSYSLNEINSYLAAGNSSCLNDTGTTPTPTPTPTPTATPTPTPVPTPTATPTPNPTPTPTPTPWPGGPTAFDFDGDGRADAAVFRPSNGTWYLSQSVAGFAATQFGQDGDKPAAADFDGDGRTDQAVFRSGVWYRLKSTGSFDTVNFGAAGDIPVPGDYDGDGRADVAVFRPSNNTWYWLGSGSARYVIQPFGASGDIPLVGDFDGDGRTDINVFRPSNGVWYRLNSSGGFVSINFGKSGDRPVAGDFDGDGRADLAIWRPSDVCWYIKGSSSGFSITPFGAPGDVPSPADFDGDGRTDIAVFRPATGQWFRLESG